jgi:hypothetical protein
LYELAYQREDHLVNEALLRSQRQAGLEKIHWTGQFGEMIQRQFDLLYREGVNSRRVMAVWRCIRILARPRRPLGLAGLPLLD